MTTDVATDLEITGDYNAVITIPSNVFVKFDATSIGSTGVTIHLNKSIMPLIESVVQSVVKSAVQRVDGVIKTPTILTMLLLYMV